MLPMNMAVIAGLMTILGLILHFGVHRVSWQKITWKWIEWVVKGIPDVLTLGILTATAIAKLNLETDSSLWAVATSLAGVMFVTWKILQYRVESCLKAADKEIKNRLERAKSESRFRTELLAAFHVFVKRKLDRTLAVVVSRQNSDRSASISNAREALTPTPQLRQILETLGTLLQARGNDKLGRRPNVRLGVYVEGADGAMKPLHAISMNQGHTEPFSSYRDHQEGFQVGATDRQSQIVRCVREKTPIMIVADCENAAEKGDFFFFSEVQRNYLKSLCVHYLEEVCDGTGRMVEGVLSIDADLSNVFEETEREDLLLCLQEFGLRIKFEMLLKSLLGEKS
ncbi:hypothetical protein [Zavarzinella formosa]|uniref:hypothetical protein n=1 Tax=Zavarzinella formosa TaxID=360055 RepID=UPI0002F6A92B|nr:hypothetical protein [Zavarzinella formosa]